MFRDSRRLAGFLYGFLNDRFIDVVAALQAGLSYFPRNSELRVPRPSHMRQRHHSKTALRTTISSLEKRSDGAWDGNPCVVNAAGLQKIACSDTS